jgi:hypothetical protein
MQTLLLRAQQGSALLPPVFFDQYCPRIMAE